MNKLARIAELKAKEKDFKDQIKEWETERKDLEATLPMGLVHEGDLVAVVKETVRFDAKRAQDTLPAYLYEQILVAKPDTATARRVLTGEEYASCQAPVGVSVTFKEEK